MGPVFRAVKAHEACFDRPFVDKHVTTRPFHRLKQWSLIWKASATDAPDIPGLREDFVSSAASLTPLTGDGIYKYFKRLPAKAHGPDGWSVAMLKQLDVAQCEILGGLYSQVERSGRVPCQWTVSIVAMLPKKALHRTPHSSPPHCLQGLHQIAMGVSRSLAGPDCPRNAMGCGNPWQVHF